jgi:pimeloyl-ACP methyl ester carboxylesterase
LTRRIVIRFIVVAVVLIASALLTEFALEARDVARHLPGQTFAKVGDARIRYQMLGVNHTGATVVFLSGTGGSIEQTDQLQSAVSSEVPSLAYDRAGYGFSQGSAAHSAGEQADELAGLLRALKIEKSVVLVAYSDSNQVARVFAGRYPESTAALYLIDPWIPEFNVILRHSPRLLFVRWIMHDLVASSLGYLRLTQRMHSWQGPESPVEQRAEAVLVRRPHYWALAQEWYATLVSSQQTREAPVPPTLPIEVIYSKPSVETKDSQVVGKLRAELVGRSSRGKLVEIEHIDHSRLMQPGPVFDLMVARIKQLSLASAP